MALNLAAIDVKHTKFSNLEGINMNINNHQLLIPSSNLFITTYENE